MTSSETPRLRVLVADNISVYAGYDRVYQLWRTFVGSLLQLLELSGTLDDPLRFAAVTDILAIEPAHAASTGTC